MKNRRQMYRGNFLRSPQRGAQRLLGSPKGGISGRARMPQDDLSPVMCADVGQSPQLLQFNAVLNRVALLVTTPFFAPACL